MTKQTTFTYRIRDKGGHSGGETISQLVPEFDLTEFMNTPNAEVFIKKAYHASVKKIMREVVENKNGTTVADLQSTEAIVARALSFNKGEIEDWMKTRDWDRAVCVKNIENIKNGLLKEMPEIASRSNPFGKEISDLLAYKAIAAVADSPDPVAEFIFSILTLPQGLTVHDL